MGEASMCGQGRAAGAGGYGDIDLLKQSVMMDPLTGAICDPEESWQMVDEMLVAQAKWLPQYADDIPGARRRIAAAKKAKTYKGTNKWRGAARVETKTVAKMRKNPTKARRSVASTDKAADQRAKDAAKGAKKASKKRKKRA